jgi:3',5'-cyclic AMP phosphodiesterase CpdA
MVNSLATAGETGGGRLWAISDLHVAMAENQRFAEQLRPTSESDWLLVAGDVAESVGNVGRTLALLADRFAQVVWVPGNHELWTHPSDPVTLRGDERYRYLVTTCRRLGVLTPEDPYPVWQDPDTGPVVIAPLFLLYDYSFMPDGARTAEEGLAIAHQAGIVAADEHMLHPDPYPSRAEWCSARVAYSEQRLTAIDPSLPTVLVNHFPLVREPTRVLRYPEFAQWCGTARTADWHLRFRAKAVVYGHLHIPRTTWYDSVRFEEVSLGYPREWRPRDRIPALRQILPV